MSIHEREVINKRSYSINFIYHSAITDVINSHLMPFQISAYSGPKSIVMSVTLQFFASCLSGIYDEHEGKTEKTGAPNTLNVIIYLYDNMANFMHSIATCHVQRFKSI
jgi:hypothetical protein